MGNEAKTRRGPHGRAASSWMRYATVAVAYRRASTVYGVDEEMQQLGTAAVHLLTMATSYMRSIGRNNATFTRVLISEPHCCIGKIRQLWCDIVAPHGRHVS